MKPLIQGAPQKYVKNILRIFFVILLSFFLVPAQGPVPANSELASKVFDSVIILDSDFISRSGSVYWLHVLVKREADFIPVQIQIPDSGATYKIMSLTPTPDQRCPFADRQSKAAGIITALEQGELLAYNSHYISDYQFATASGKSMDLILDVQGKLFVVRGLKVTGECFWAQE